MNKIYTTWKKTRNVLKTSIFLSMGVLLLLSLINNAVHLESFISFIKNNYFVDVFLTAIGGSFAAGNPITSYIISGELLNKGVSMAAVTVLILTWTTVGVIQLPAESIMLGKRFAIIRNLFSFISAILIAIIIDLILF